MASLSIWQNDTVASTDQCRNNNDAEALNEEGTSAARRCSCWLVPRIVTLNGGTKMSAANGPVETSYDSRVNDSRRLLLLRHAAARDDVTALVRLGMLLRDGLKDRRGRTGVAPVKPDSLANGLRLRVRC